MLAIVFLFAVDVALSSFWTCYKPAEQASQATETKSATKKCAAFNGPLLTAARLVLATLNEYGTGIVAIFTIVLAISTLLLW